MSGEAFEMHLKTQPAPKDYPVRLAGHGLASEGIPAFLSEGCPLRPCMEWDEYEFPAQATGSPGWGGHARCSCGAESGHLPSQGARRRWHKDHKRAVVASVSP